MMNHLTHFFVMLHSGFIRHSSFVIRIVLVNLPQDQKIAGVLAPLFALRRDDDLGIGDVAALRQFIDWSKENGFKLVQLLPINEMGGDNSPYNAISAMAIEPTTLHLAPGSPEDLGSEDFEALTSAAHVERLRHGPVKHARVKKLKRRLLENAFETFMAGASEERRAAFLNFQSTERDWLDDYSFFRVLMEANRGSEAWDQWAPEQRSMADAQQWWAELRADRRGRLENRRLFFAYVQWIARQQWEEMKKYAEEQGVALMGDIPFGVSYYSADVFAHAREFALDWSGGAPPEPYFKDDEFTQKWGQNWGIPSIAGMSCARTTSPGGDVASTASELFSTSFGSITCSGFIGFTPFRGGRRGTRNFSR